MGRPFGKTYENYKERRKAIYNTPEGKVWQRNRTLKYKYGITIEDYNKMFADQEGKCGICKRHYFQLGKTLAVDHCHTTGKVRQLLCDFCNRTLGVYEKRPEIFKAFDEYLEKFKCQR